MTWHSLIYFANDLVSIAYEVDELKNSHFNLKKCFQELNELTDSLNDSFLPCLSVGPIFTTQISKLYMIVANQGQQLDIVDVNLNS